ncbi:hypothetical protein ACFV3R_16910 [Streptomyces sp. NPDC059740]|uniref:hypothetical protein n=1 Tax=Streptomyces sp. NPDC059740 TaxID=3346926 RepID=UPI003669F9FF
MGESEQPAAPHRAPVRHRTSRSTNTGTRQARSVVALCVWTLLLVVALPLLVLHGATARLGAATALQCVVVAHAGTALARVLTAPTSRVSALGFWLFSYVWLGLAPLPMLATGTYPRGFVVDADTAFAACALVEAGLTAYSVGAALAGRRPTHTSTVLRPLLSRTMAPARVLLLSAAALLLAVVLIIQQGGPAAFFHSRQAANTAAEQLASNDSAGRALAAWGLSVPAFTALAALAHVQRVRGGDRVLRGLRWLLLPALVAVNVVVNNPVSQPRFWAGTVLLTLVFSLPVTARPRAFRVVAGVLTATVLVVFPYSDYFRYDTHGDVQVVSLAEQFTTNGDYDAFQQIATGVDYVAKHGFTPTAALGPPLFFVPRSLWPGKPDDAGVLLARHAGYSFDNLSAPLWIETYLWAGPAAVVALFALLGAVSTRVDRIFHRHRRSGTLGALLVPAAGFYQLVLLRGSLLGVLGPLALVVVLPFLVSRRAPRHSNGPPAPALMPAPAPRPLPPEGVTR